MRYCLLLSIGGFPKAIISDRDSEFLSDLWEAIFKTLGTNLLVSTAYHPQTDGQSEPTNQTIEIALRIHISISLDKLWDAFMTYLRSSLNNSTNASIGMPSNEMCYGIKLNDGTNIVGFDAGDHTDLVIDCTRNRQEAADALAFASAEATSKDDNKHRSLTMEIGSKASIKLHKEHCLPGLDDAKPADQRAGLFKILDKVGSLAYKLDLPASWRIHPVISVAVLKPAPRGNDPYDRPQKEGQEVILDNNDPIVTETYETEKLLDKRITGRGKFTTVLLDWLISASGRAEWARLLIRV